MLARRLAAGLALQVEPKDPMVGGLTVSAWWALWWQCHRYDGMGAVQRTEWPDAGGLACQAMVTVTVFAVILNQVLKQQEQERKSDGR